MPKRKLYRILEAGGLHFAGKYFPEHGVFDLVAEGWGESDVPGALQSGLIAEAGEAETIPVKIEKKSAVKEQDDE